MDPIRLGYFGSICFALLDVVSLIRVIFFPESLNHPIPPSILSKDGIIYSLPKLALVIAIVWAAISRGNLGEYGQRSREIRKGWSFMLCGGVALVLFVGLFSVMDGILGIFTYMISFCCSLYAFLVFRKHLKGTIS